MYLSSVNEIKTTWPGPGLVLYHLLVKLFVTLTCEVIEESHVHCAQLSLVL